jgi:hypothetical protein
MPFELWRQHDNGQRFLVGRYPTRADAERRVEELTRTLHKQGHWIVGQSGDPGRQDAP